MAKNPYTEILRRARISYVHHPVFGEVPSWPSLEHELKQALLDVGAYIERHIKRIEHIGDGLLVEVAVDLHIPDQDTIHSEGAAWKPLPKEDKKAADPVGAALTMASRRALQFALLAGATGEDHDEEVQPPAEPQPTAEPPQIKPAKPKKGEPEQQDLGEDVGAPKEKVQELSLLLRELSAMPARRQFMADVKAVTGRPNLDTLSRRHVEAAITNLSRYREEYEHYAQLAPDERASLNVDGTPWVLADPADAAEVAITVGKPEN